MVCMLYNKLLNKLYHRIKKGSMILGYPKEVLAQKKFVSLFCVSNKRKFLIAFFKARSCEYYHPCFIEECYVVDSFVENVNQIVND